MNDEVDDFLAHYGVPGMKWGVRRGQKQLAKRMGRTRESVTADEAAAFRAEVKSYKRQGLGVDFRQNKVNPTLLEVKNFRGSAGQKISKEYADAIIKQGNKELTVSVLGSYAAGAVGAAFAYTLMRG